MAFPAGLAEAKDEAARAALIEAGRLLFALEPRFVAAARTLDQLPPPGLPEVAFAGRSNVGKSSLLNALTGRRGLARVSATPGRTRELVFFDLASRLLLVDMPGYGYAEVAKSVREAWEGTMFAYLRGRPSLRRVVLLIDARVGFKPADEAAMRVLDEAAVAYQITLTKADKVKPAVLDAMRRRAEAVARAHTAAHPLVLATSAETGAGIAELRAELASLARA
ncbi:MAG: ribosome biogenesis GTP-binding protein YihA/YsxC [Elioraea sp.]|nr:ribosome biogenesis GTP-binding protein YihA/YsxC [Elioraea sp.]